MRVFRIPKSNPNPTLSHMHIQLGQKIKMHIQNSKRPLNFVHQFEILYSSVLYNFTQMVTLFLLQFQLPSHTLPLSSISKIPNPIERFRFHNHGFRQEITRWPQQGLLHIPALQAYWGGQVRPEQPTRVDSSGGPSGEARARLALALQHHHRRRTAAD